MPVIASDEISEVMTEDWPLLNYLEQGILKGPVSEIVQKIIEKLGIKKKLRYTPGSGLTEMY